MNNNGMKKRWISLYVENQVGVLSKISGLFSGKSYNLDSLTVGTTEDPTVSRMTIATVSDDETFEQIKKQLNRLVEVIKVIDFTSSTILISRSASFSCKIPVHRSSHGKRFPVSPSNPHVFESPKHNICFITSCTCLLSFSLFYLLITGV